jgi:hypothetical protein
MKENQMKKHSAWLAAGLLVFVVLACNYSASVGGAGLHMAKDDGKGQPGAETKTFSPSDHTIHCVAKLDEAKDGTKVTFAWWSVDTERSKNEKIKDLDYTTKGPENVVHAHLTAPEDWPKGKYKCVATINGADKSVEYTVE